MGQQFGLSGSSQRIRATFGCQRDRKAAPRKAAANPTAPGWEPSTPTKPPSREGTQRRIPGPAVQKAKKQVRPASGPHGQRHLDQASVTDRVRDRSATLTTIPAAVLASQRTADNPDWRSLKAENCRTSTTTSAPSPQQQARPAKPRDCAGCCVRPVRIYSLMSPQASGANSVWCSPLPARYGTSSAKLAWLPCLPGTHCQERLLQQTCAGSVHLRYRACCGRRWIFRPQNLKTSKFSDRGGGGCLWIGWLPAAFATANACCLPSSSVIWTCFVTIKCPNDQLLNGSLTILDAGGVWYPVGLV